MTISDWYQRNKKNIILPLALAFSINTASCALTKSFNTTGDKEQAPISQTYEKKDEKKQQTPLAPVQINPHSERKTEQKSVENAKAAKTTLEQKIKRTNISKKQPDWKTQHDIGTFTYDAKTNTIYHKVGPSLKGFLGGNENYVFDGKGYGKVGGVKDLSGIIKYSLEDITKKGFKFEAPEEAFLGGYKIEDNKKVYGASVKVKNAYFSGKYSGIGKEAKNYTQTVVKTEKADTTKQIATDKINADAKAASDAKIASDAKAADKNVAATETQLQFPYSCLEKVTFESIYPWIDDISLKQSNLYTTKIVDGKTETTLKPFNVFGTQYMTPYLSSAKECEGLELNLREVYKGKPADDIIYLSNIGLDNNNNNIIRDSLHIPAWHEKLFYGKGGITDINGQKLDGWTANNGNYLFGFTDAMQDYRLELKKIGANESNIIGYINAKRSDATKVTNAVAIGVLAYGVGSALSGSGTSTTPSITGGNAGQGFGGAIR